jgi:hypothetical protein
MRVWMLPSSVLICPTEVHSLSKQSHSLRGHQPKEAPVRLHQTLMATLMVFLLACDDSGTPFGDQSGTSGRVKPPELHGALHASLGSDWTDFERALATVTPWTGGWEQKRCSNMLLCGLSFSKVPVRLQANPEAKDADSTNVGTHGTILMKLVNTGNRPTAKYDLNPSPSEYYVVVRRSDPPAWQWALVEKAGGSAQPRVVGDWKAFSPCVPKHPVPTVSSARFRDCGDKELSGVKKSSMFGLAGVSHSLSAIQFALFAEAPGWISCAYGCCTLAY